MSATPTEPNTDRLRVLVVDDEPDTRTSMCVLLRLWGHEPLDAADGHAALAAALRFRPDVVFLDLGLPEMDGCAVAWRLRRAPELEGVRLVAVTGHAEPANELRAKECGCNDFLAKPAELDRLEQLLRRVASERIDVVGATSPC